MAFVVPPRVLLDDAADLMKRGEQAIAAGESQIDLSAVTQSDSGLLACLLAWHRAAEALGKTLVVANPPAGLRGIAELYGVVVLTLG